MTCPTASGELLEEHSFLDPGSTLRISHIQCREDTTSQAAGYENDAMPQTVWYQNQATQHINA